MSAIANYEHAARLLVRMEDAQAMVRRLEQLAEQTQDDAILDRISEAIGSLKLAIRSMEHAVRIARDNADKSGSLAQQIGQLELAMIERNKRRSA